MKKILTFFACAAILTACNSNKNDTKNLQASRDSIKKAITDSIKLDSFQRAEAQAREQAKIDSIARVKAASQMAASKATTARTTHRTRHYSSSAGVQPLVQGESYQQTQKKGWSSAAKGAVIGAGAGAATGLIVDHKNAKGAIIGGVLGAGTGYVIGRQHDKKTGRAN